MDYEELLGIFVIIAQELDKDKKSAGNIKEIADKILQSKDPYQLNMLENAVLSLFDKVKAEFPKKSVDYSSNDTNIRLDDLVISRNKPDSSSPFSVVQYFKDNKEKSNLFLRCLISPDAWLYLHTYITWKVHNKQFDKHEFINNILKLASQEQIQYDTKISKPILEKYFPMSYAEDAARCQAEINSLIQRYSGWHNNLKEGFEGGAECCWQIRNSYMHVIAQELTHIISKRDYFYINSMSTSKAQEFDKFIAKAKKKYSELEARYTRNHFSKDHKYDEAMFKYHMLPSDINEDEEKNDSK